MFTVRVRNAAGTAREIRVSATSAARAIRAALRETEERYPAQGWRAEWAI